MDRVGIGIIGCGNISAAYLKAAKAFPILDVRAVADLNPAAAEARGAEFGVPAKTVEALLADPTIEIVVNLTVPLAHVEVGLQAIAAGKHVHSEKPLGIDVAEARPLLDAAKAKGLRVGCAPGHVPRRRPPDLPQADRRGRHRPAARRHRLLHVPRPRALASEPRLLLSPRRRPGARHGALLRHRPGQPARPGRARRRHHRARPRRAARSPASRSTGTKIPVEVATHAAGTLEFVSGPVVTMVMSFDVPRHRHRPIEIYGSEGAMAVPDPNWFGGQIEIGTAAGDWRAVIDRARLRQRQFPHHRRRRHGARHPQEPAAPGERRARLPRARGDGGGAALVRRGRHIDHRQRGPERPAMLPADLAAAISTSGEHTNIQEEQRMREALIVWGGWNGHEPEQGAHIVTRDARGGGLQGLRREHDRGLRRPGDRRDEPDRADLHDVEDREGGARQPRPRGARRRRPRRLSRRHVRRLPRGGRLPVHVRRPVGRPSRQHHRLPRQHHPARRSGDGRASAISPTAPSSTTCMSTPRTRCWRRPPSPASTRRGSRAW